jgi:methylenetetrahydrofolate reductase (NADPH)
MNCMKELKKYNPLFGDVTWGAGGSTSDLTVDLCIRAKDEIGLNPNMHLTCTNMEKSKIDAALASCRDSGIRNILALRGDPPVGQEAWTATEGGLACALDLVRYIRDQDTDNFFSIAVAGYPEGHPTAMTVVEGGVESLSETELGRYSFDVDAEGNETILVCRDEAFERELNYLKEKVDAGASLILTQMFFDAEVFGTFVKSCRAKGIHVPVVPGIMCISNYDGFKRMTKFCKSRVTKEMMARLDAVRGDEAAVKELGITLGVELCQRLLEIGAPGLHFYTLNTSKVTTSIWDRLGYTKIV